MNGKFEVEPVVMTLLFALIEAVGDTIPVDQDKEPEFSSGWYQAHEAIKRALDQGMRHMRGV